ncbi:DUF6471 domain-containing protein [Roseicella aerolata]|uniref:DUF6471 domain-containing protein n=1 Tax=Roseicella aerolata TaxID=2883479 RepID=A0A9X1IJX2_9PROT|nr:DUF6471 domain-containing protein [Roseicella aerolata]MCB4825524.1 DUF6471 domain-containing protein [Roseicella aerolata]
MANALDMMANITVKGAWMAETEAAASTDTAEWQARAKNLLKAELKRRGVTYAQLVEKLAVIGVHETEPNIRNKIARGSFTAVFLLQVMAAIGAKELRID